MTAPPAPLAFRVIGHPNAQGSHKIVPAGEHHRITDDKPGLRSWRHDIAAAAHHARQQHEHPGFVTGPVSVRLVFRIRRPVSLPKRIRLPCKRPDLDKYIRAVLDSLTSAGVYHDDGQVQAIAAAKYFAADGQPLGVAVSVEPADMDELDATMHRHPAGKGDT